MPRQARGLLARLGGHLAGFVAFCLHLPGFLRGSGSGFFVGLCRLGGLLLDLLDAGLCTGHPFSACLQFGGQHGGLLFGGGAALLRIGQRGA